MNTGAFRATNENIDNVTIKNCMIRNMPAKGIHASKDFSDGWTIESDEFYGNRYGVHVGDSFSVKINYIHHNIGDPTSATYALRGGAYGGYQSSGSVFEDNEISYNGPEQKMVATNSVTFRRNFVHHNHTDGIWYDADNVNVLIEDNRVEDNTRHGIIYEVSGNGIVRGNTIRRNGRTGIDSGIFVSASKDIELYYNTPLRTTLSASVLRGLQPCGPRGHPRRLGSRQRLRAQQYHQAAGGCVQRYRERTQGGLDLHEHTGVGVYQGLEESAVQLQHPLRQLTLGPLVVLGSVQDVGGVADARGRYGRPCGVEVRTFNHRCECHGTPSTTRMTGHRPAGKRNQCRHSGANPHHAMVGRRSFCQPDALNFHGPACLARAVVALLPRHTSSPTSGRPRMSTDQPGDGRFASHGADSASSAFICVRPRPASGAKTSASSAIKTGIPRRSGKPRQPDVSIHNSFSQSERIRESLRLRAGGVRGDERRCDGLACPAQPLGGIGKALIDWGVLASQSRVDSAPPRSEAALHGMGWRIRASRRIVSVNG